MHIWKSLEGMLEIEIVSASVAEMLSAVNRAGVVLYDVRATGDLTARVHIRRSEYDRLCQLIDRRGDSLKIIQRSGAFWMLMALKRRPVLIVAVLIYVILILYLPSRILFVRVEGNQNISTESILDKAESCGIYFGASRRDVRNERVKNSLLEAEPQLQWAGVNTSGCVAVITVKERTEATENEAIDGFGNVIANQDGIIREMTVLRGNPLCQVGQAVKAGQVLVSGYTDCGIMIKATAADAEIYASTKHDLELIIPSVRFKRTELDRQTLQYSLQIGKKLINLFKGSGISDASCVKMYERYQLTLPGGFQLPITLIVSKTVFCEIGTAELSDPQEFLWAEEYAESYLISQMLAGAIERSELSCERRDSVFYQYGKYFCLEMIGQKRSEEIIKDDGKGN